MKLFEKIIPIIVVFLGNNLTILYAKEDNSIFHYPSKWEVSNVTKKACFEYITFRSNNEINMDSGSEKLAAQYTVLKSENNDDFYKFTINIYKDNLKPDCNGNISNDAGNHLIYYVKVISNTRLLFCESDNLDKCEFRVNLYK